MRRWPLWDSLTTALFHQRACLLGVLIGLMPSRSDLFAITCFLPAQPVDVLRSYSSSSSRTDFSVGHGREVSPEFPLVRPHRPDDACRFVCLRYTSNIHVSPRG